jgi:hypothetical protein
MAPDPAAQSSANDLLMHVPDVHTKLMVKTSEDDFHLAFDDMVDRRDNFDVIVESSSDESCCQMKCIEGSASLPNGPAMRLSI